MRESLVPDWLDLTVTASLLDFERLLHRSRLLFLPSSLQPTGTESVLVAVITSDGYK